MHRRLGVSSSLDTVRDVFALAAGRPGCDHGVPQMYTLYRVAKSGSIVVYGGTTVVGVCLGTTVVTQRFTLKTSGKGIAQTAVCTFSQDGILSSFCPCLRCATPALPVCFGPAR